MELSRVRSIDTAMVTATFSVSTASFDHSAIVSRGLIAESAIPISTITLVFTATLSCQDPDPASSDQSFPAEQRGVAGKCPGGAMLRKTQLRVVIRRGRSGQQHDCRGRAKV